MKAVFKKSAIALLLYTALTPAYSEPMQNDFKDCKVASDETLEQMRGGFSINNSQILLSLGFQQVTYINGILAATTTINLPQLNSVTPIPIQQNFIPSQIIQNGPGNTYIPPVPLPSNVMTVIQNSLNNQVINHMTIINATIASTQLINAMNMASTLRQALPFSVR